MSERKQNKYHCCIETSLHQQLLPRNKTQQQTDILEIVKNELNETTDKKIDTKFQLKSRNDFWEILNALKKNFEEAIIILEKIEESESLSLDQTSRLIVNKSGTGILVADFLYDLQQRLLSFHPNFTKSRLFKISVHN